MLHEVFDIRDIPFLSDASNTFQFSYVFQLLKLELKWWYLIRREPNADESKFFQNVFDVLKSFFFSSIIITYWHTFKPTGKSCLFGMLIFSPIFDSKILLIFQPKMKGFLTFFFLRTGRSLFF